MDMKQMIIGKRVARVYFYLICLLGVPAMGFCWELPVAGEVGVAYDSFRSLPQGSWEGSTGALVKINVAVPVDILCEGLGLQAGGSYGVYDWSGHAASLSGNLKEVQQGGFVTAGAFWVTPYCEGVNAAIVYDWMINKNYAIFGLSPNL